MAFEVCEVPSVPEELHAKEKSEGMSYQIYCLRFPCGHTYVGQTIQTLDDRLAQHRNAPCNRKLAELLRDFPEPEVEVLARAGTSAKALLLEQHFIREQPKSVNRYFHSDGWEASRIMNGDAPGARPVRRWNGRTRTKRYERSDRDQRCRWCKVWKTADEYNTDRSRSSGLSSMCKECKKMVERVRRDAIREGKSASEAYEKARQRVKRKMPIPPRRHRPRPVDQPNPCTKCGEMKAPEFFYKPKSRRTGKRLLDSWCKQCHNAYQRERYHRNKANANRQRA